MELLSTLNNASIEGIPLLALKKELEALNGDPKSCVFISYNDRIKSIKCIRDYYLNPLTKRKMPKVNIVNPCHSIQGTFNVLGCQSTDCKNCHIQMIDKYYNGEVFLTKRNKK